MTTQAGTTPISNIQTKSKWQRQIGESIAGLLFLAPAMLIFLVFLIIPIAFALFISLTDWNGITPLGQQAQAATGTVQFTNQTDQAVTIPEGTVLIGAIQPATRTQEQTVKFVLSEAYTIQAGESIIINATPTRPEQLGLLDQFQNPRTTVPDERLTINLPIDSIIPNEAGGYSLTVTNITDNPIDISTRVALVATINGEEVRIRASERVIIAPQATSVVNVVAQDEAQLRLIENLEALPIRTSTSLRDIFRVDNPVGDEVSGYSITITNISDDVATLPEGLELTTVGDYSIEFITREAVTIPAGAGMTANVPIIARNVENGNSTNVPANSITTLPSDYQGVVSVTNPDRTSGGLNQDFNLIGLRNYQALLNNPQGISQRDFFISLRNTIYFVLGVVPTQTVLALLLAVILNQRWLRGKGFFRTAFYFPSITSSVVISIIFMWMFTKGGLINIIIGALFPNYQSVTWLNDPNGVLHNLLGVFGINRSTVGDWANTNIAGLTAWEWLSGPSVTMFTIMILNTWTTIGTMMVIFLAALQNIPNSVYEAASIDGATAWQTFRRITVPLLAPTTFFVVTLGLIGTFQVFDQIYVISSGGPAKTTLTIAYIVYQNGFNNSQMGLAAATALVLFVIIFVFTMIQRLFTRETADL
jgi:multiple sugar transport system permease protein